MMSYNSKNYMTQGGDELVIGGKLTIEDGAEVTGLSGGGGGGGSYTLPTASADTLGGVKAKVKDDETVEVAVDGTGKLYVPTYPTVTAYTLPTASADTLGGVKAAAKSDESVAVAVDEDGTLYVPAYPAAYTLPTASAETLGGVKPKAKTDESVEVTVDESGKLFAPAYPSVPAAPGNATAAKEGLVKQAAAVADAADTDGATLQTTLNGLLAALRTAGIVAES